MNNTNSTERDQNSRYIRASIDSVKGNLDIDDIKYFGIDIGSPLFNLHLNDIANENQP